MKRSTAFILTFLFITCCSFAFADKQDILLSKGIGGRNVIPDIAVNTITGDVLVVWTNSDGGGNLTVWSRLLKRRNDGSYAVSPLRRLSPAAGYFANAHVAFIPWKKKYLVTWDTYNFAMGLVPGNIEGQLVKANGKPKKSPYTIVSDGYANNWPRIAVIDTSDEYLPKAVRAVLLTYTAFPVEGKLNGSGVVAQMLSTKKFKSKGGRTILFPIRSNKHPAPAADPAALVLSDLEGMAFVNDLMPMRKWFVISYSTRPPFGFVAGPEVSDHFGQLDRNANFTWFKMDDDGNSLDYDRDRDTIIGTEAGLAKLNRIPDRDNPGLPSDDFGAGFGDTRTSLFVRGTFQAEFFGDEFDGDLDGYLLVGSLVSGSIDGAYLPRNYDSEIQDQAADLPLWRSAPPADDVFPTKKQPFNYWIFSEGGNIKTQAMTMKNNGKIKVDKKTVNRVFHGDALGWVEAKGVPGTGSIAIAWQKEIAGGAAEIRIHIFN